MTASRTAARLTRLYPPGWRARYGEELQTLILDMSGERRVPWRIRADVAGAGGRERLRALGQGDGSPQARARGGASLVLWAWALFILAGVIVQKTSEHWQGALPSGSHAAATVAFDVLVGVAVLGGVLVLAGIALTLPALARLLARGGWPRIRRQVRTAAATTVVWLAASAGLVIWAHSVSASARDGHDALYAIGAVAWGALSALALGAWTAAATRTAACLELRATTLRLEAHLASAVSAAMAIMASATAVWWVTVASASPSALTGTPGGHGSPIRPALVSAMVLMLLAVGLGALGARRATRALPQLADVE